MKSHFYLIRTSMKNRIKELIHKPVKLVMYLLVILLLAAALVASLLGAKHSEGSLSVSYLLPIVFAFLLLFYFFSIQKGLSAGDAIFEMSDVNLLFVSPVNPRATLLYGVIRMVGMSFGQDFLYYFKATHYPILVSVTVELLYCS